MTVILVNDLDGHSNAYVYDLANMKKLLQLVLEANAHNTMLDDPEGAQRLLDDPAVTADQVREFMEEYGPVDRSRGGMIFFVELQDVLNADYNPFT